MHVHHSCCTLSQVNISASKPEASHFTFWRLPVTCDVHQSPDGWRLSVTSNVHQSASVDNFTHYLNWDLPAIFKVHQSRDSWCLSVSLDGLHSHMWGVGQLWWFVVTSHNICQSHLMFIYHVDVYESHLMHVTSQALEVPIQFTFDVNQPH